MMRSPQTTRNMTRYPVEVGATESILAGLPDTDSLIELPDAFDPSRKEARDFILDIIQDIHMAVEQLTDGDQTGEERFYYEWQDWEPIYSRSLEMKEAPELLLIAATLPITAWQGDVLPIRQAAAQHAGSTAEYLEAVTRATLLGLRHLVWECAAALIGDGILTWNGRWLVWQETEVRPAWRTSTEAGR